MTTTPRYSRQGYIFPRLSVSANAGVTTTAYRILRYVLCQPEWGYGAVFDNLVWARARLLLQPPQCKRVWIGREEPWQC